MEKIELSNGYVILKPFIDRKTMREYRRLISINQAVKSILDENGKPKMKDGFIQEKVIIDPIQMDLGFDVLVSGTIKEAFIDGTSCVVDENFIDVLDNDDFDKILEAVLNKKNKKEEEKKS